MAPFNIPAPSIIPLRLSVFGGSKHIDTNTKIQLFCETYLDHEIFFTLDGTKPQPYAGIVQGSKAIKYSSPFYLPSGKITIKAIAINANIHTMCSSVVTKCFEVTKVKSIDDDGKGAKIKQTKKSKLTKKCNNVENKKNVNGLINVTDENSCDMEIHSLNPDTVKDEEEILDCFDQAFIGSSQFDTANSEIEDDSVEDESSFHVNINMTDDNSILEEELDDINLCDDVDGNEKDSLSDAMEELAICEKNTDEPHVSSAYDTAESVETQFCCLKCDLTLQQCISCNRMNGVSSKFCIGCGKQLSRFCSFCNKYNPSVATFCQYCGKKLNSKSIKHEPCLKVDHSIMAQAESKDVAVQVLPVIVDKNIQTVTDRSPLRKSPDLKKRIPHHSPGRGYWHQQLDYICNYLKSHAYNNVEFRKEISEPMLCDFKSVQIIKGENDVQVTVVFSSLKDKDRDSEEAKSKRMKDMDT